MKSEWVSPAGRKLRLEQGDITRVAVDAIVNAANAALAGGGGVDGAIHRAAGEELKVALGRIRREQGGCPTGGAVATTAGKLPARWVFHAVGPVYRGGHQDEAALLASCYRTCLALAEEHGARRLSFPSISTGVYGYPVEEAAPIAVRTVAEHLRRAETTVQEAVFVLFDGTTYAAYQQALSTV